MEELKKHRINQRLKDTSAFHPGEEPSSDIFLKAILKKARCSGEDLLKAWKRFEKKTRLADLHEVRIDLKKWRYLLEIQSQYTASPDSAHLKKMKAAQDRLGRIHDVEVLHDLLKTAEIPKKYRNKKGPKELNRMKKELKSQLKTDLHSFHRDGEKILLNLYSERRGA